MERILYLVHFLRGHLSVGVGQSPAIDRRDLLAESDRVMRQPSVCRGHMHSGNEIPSIELPGQWDNDYRTQWFEIVGLNDDDRSRFSLLVPASFRRGEIRVSDFAAASPNSRRSRRRHDPVVARDHAL